MNKYITTSTNVTSSQYLKSLYNLVFIFFSLGEYKQAEQYCLKLKDLNSKKYGETHPEYANVLASLSAVYTSLNRNEDAEKSVMQCLSIYEAYYDKRHPNYAGGLCNLGAIYYAKREYGKAIPILQECMAQTKKMLGEEHNYYYVSINSLSLIYYNTGAYEKAEPLMLESLEIRKKIYNNTGPFVVTALNNIANLYQNLNNYDKAERYLQEAVGIFEKNRALEKEMPRIYAQLGAIYIRKGLIDKFKFSYETALAIQKKYAGENSPTYLSILGSYADNMALLYTSETDIVAERMFKEVYEKRKKVLGTEHPDYFLTLNNFAVFYILRNKPGEAQKLLTEAIPLAEKIYDKNELPYASFLINVADMNERVGNYQLAGECYAKILNFVQTQFIHKFLFFTEQERVLFWDLQKSLLEIQKSFANKYIKEDPSFSVLSYNSELLSKNFLLQSSNLHLIIAKNKDKELIKNWNNILSSKAYLIELDETIIQLEKEILLRMSIEPTKLNRQALNTMMKSHEDEEIKDLYKSMSKIKDIYSSLNDDIESIEKFMIKEVEDELVKDNGFSIQWPDIQTALDDNDVAVEFLAFQDLNNETLEYSKTRYSALILHKDYKYPKMVYLCEEDEIKAAIDPSGHDLEKIYSLIWQPLEEYFGNAKNIYVAPSGLLNAVSFNGIKIKSGYLCDEYAIHNVLSTRDIIASKKEKKESGNNKTALLVGGADYEISNNELAQINKGLKDNFHTNLTRGIIDDLGLTRGQGFGYLPGSRREVQSITQKLSGLDWKTTLLVDDKATKVHLKSLLSASAPDLIHISTHGFYLPPENEKTKYTATESIDKQNPYRFMDNPLLRSGLAFTGANYAWNGNEVEDEADDGILTAYEVSNMDLSNTKLVVLSACDTGLGDVVDSEGVYGLQRAFRMAGAQSMLLTLWKIPDTETVEFMNNFYSNWTSGESLNFAFQGAQKTMRNKYPDNPEKWAGFVLIE